MIVLAPANTRTRDLRNTQRTFDLLAARDDADIKCRIQRRPAQFTLDVVNGINAPAVDTPDRVARLNSNLLKRTSSRNRLNDNPTSPPQIKSTVKRAHRARENQQRHEHDRGSSRNRRPRQIKEKNRPRRLKLGDADARFF